MTTPAHVHQPARTVPLTYRLLAVFCGEPLEPLRAFELSGLKPVGGRAPDEAYRQIARLRDNGLIRWVEWAEPAKDGRRGTTKRGYVLTGSGESALSVYGTLYGPAMARRADGPTLGEIARSRLQAAHAQAADPHPTPTGEP